MLYISVKWSSVVCFQFFKIYFLEFLAVVCLFPVGSASPLHLFPVLSSPELYPSLPCDTGTAFSHLSKGEKEQVPV